ncbi:MAG: RsmB/NOP family class I SAM-dependent RNA methyltransferase, partial [Candidatus Gracilibacteria bacterium]|nr:RsmB/NOP family class I SAM-dependent RNA methyltransferase [Candidatus Gracilibacteria bacterium]
MEINKLFFERIEKIYSKKDIEIIKKGLNIKKRNVSFRVNTTKSTKEEIELELIKNNIKIEKIDFIKNAYILKNSIERDLWNLDFYKDGKIYIQTISSQIPVNIMDLQSGKTILDVASAPGGKTSQMADFINNNGKIFANEIDKIRIEKLNFTLKRQSSSCVEVIKNDARNLKKVFKEKTFDYILADLPCSAEGRINLSIEKSYGFWKEEIIQKNSNLQKEILENNIDLLKENGILVYSTCTIAPEENEEVVEYILQKFSNLELIDFNINIENIRNGIKEFNGKKYNFDTNKVKRFIPNENT